MKEEELFLNWKTLYSWWRTKKKEFLLLEWGYESKQQHICPLESFWCCCCCFVFDLLISVFRFRLPSWNELNTNHKSFTTTTWKMAMGNKHWIIHGKMVGKRVLQNVGHLRHWGRYFFLKTKRLQRSLASIFFYRKQLWTWGELRSRTFF